MYIQFIMNNFTFVMIMIVGQTLRKIIESLELMKKSTIIITRLQVINFVGGVC